MALDIGEAVRDGVDRATERNGLVLMGAFVLLGVASAVVTQTFTAETATVLAEFARQQGEPFDPTQLGPTPLALPLSLGVALALALALALVAEALRMVAVRTFVSSQRAGVPREFVRRRIAWVTLNGFFGGVVVGALVIIGLVFLVVPGVFLYVSFFFVRQEIAVEDKNFVEALSGSVRLTKGNRFELFALAVVLFAIGVAVSILAAFVPGISGAILAVVLSAGVGVYVSAAAAAAYRQLRAERRGEGADTFDTGDGDDEWDDPPGLEL